ncbi:hypothetical protein AB4037_03960 [Labrys sp. KB_33_2]|uniref:hypothetical protein n=1 Tax=Labrys sp. KB_33_2 TaxID=3237479 RepID=UPI003F8FEE02
MLIIEALAGRGLRVVSMEKGLGAGALPAPGNFIRPPSSAMRSSGSTASNVMPSSVLFATCQVPALMCLTISIGGDQVPAAGHDRIKGSLLKRVHARSPSALAMIAEGREAMIAGSCPAWTGKTGSCPKICRASGDCHKIDAKQRSWQVGGKSAHEWVLAISGKYAGPILARSIAVLP